jgi:hypothetical protein
MVHGSQKKAQKSSKPALEKGKKRRPNVLSTVPSS